MLFENYFLCPQRFQHVASTGQRLLSTLRHCTALVRQAEEGRGARLRAEKERCRVLEEALAVLAAEHHDLEQSFAEQISENKVDYILSFESFNSTSKNLYNVK